MERPGVCVIFNPAAGRGQAARRLNQARRRLGKHALFQPTEHAGHARELAQRAAESGYGMVVAAGGDGTVHDVANGLLLAGRPDVQFGIIPIGSANDYYASLEMEPLEGTLKTRTVDVGRVRGPDGREKYFVCCLGLGLNGLVTVESRKSSGCKASRFMGWPHYAPCGTTTSVRPWPSPWTSNRLCRCRR